ncbi:MAG: methylmalonyl-CoA mutase [Alphaproteobacteria bacterium]|jgi:methylmalonyl-CoA mutase|nr:methylmalonyl-CoA mutase [Alphaproteobacteria bacterium]
MSDTFTLASDFQAPSYDDWVAEVEKGLKGAPFDKKMYTKTYEGITLQPVYTRADWPGEGDPSGFPGAMPFTRGSQPFGHAMAGWDIRQMHMYPDVAAANAQILSDLQRGVTSLLVRFDQAGQAGLDGDAPDSEMLAGRDGVMVYSVDDLEALLREVDLTIAPVAIEAGPQFMAGAALLAGLWERRGIAAGEAKGAFNADPLAALAAGGSLPVPVATALARLGDLAAHTAATYPTVTSVRVDTTPYHDAGASETQDLGISMATAVAYLRAMSEAGVDIDRACRQITFSYALGSEFFMGIAKLRAARKLWARIAESCGASEPARAMNLHGVTALRSLTQRDPWVNMLRGTISGFAAAVGGAEHVTVRPFDGAIRAADDLSRRVARNTQVILQEESYLTKVVDPAGGSWYIETLTDHLAKTAWANFQDIEKAGGIVAALESGLIRGKIDETWQERLKNLSTRKDPITGVSEFPNIHEKPVERLQADYGALQAKAAERLTATRQGTGKVDLGPALSAGTPGVLTASCIDAATKGATLGALAAALKDGAGATLEPLPQRRLAQPFEELRDASDAHKEKTGDWPAIFLANLGRIAQHTARATYAKNFFEVGGIQALSNEGFHDPESCAKALAGSGARLAIICGTDGQYEEMVASFAPALKQAGATRVFLAGNPGDKKQSYMDAGVDGFIFMGCNVLETLRGTLAHLGVIES